MAKGAYYPINQKMWLYTDTFSAADYGSVGLYPVSTVSPNTGSDKDKYNAIYNGEKGNCYVNTAFGWSYAPTVNLWWVRETYAGGGWAIGWTNDSKNAGASVPTLSTSSTDIGNSVTVNFNRQSQNFTHTIWWRLSGGSWYTLVTKTDAASYTWNTNNNKSTLLGLLPSSTSGSFEIYVSTYNGDTEIGHKSVYMTLKVPASIKPTIGSIKAEETNSKLKSTLKVGSFVKGISQIKVSATGVTAGQGSSISSYTWQIYNTTKTGASPTFSPLSFGSGVFKLTVSDKRGRSTTYTGSNITQISYSQPSITSFSGSRYNDTNKTQVQIILKANQTKLSDKNTMRYKLEYKKSTETAWKQLKAYSSYQLGNFNVTTVQTITNDANYNIRASVQDLIGNTTTSIYTVNTTSKKWLEVTNGEMINVIGTLKNNGVGFPTRTGFSTGQLFNFPGGIKIQTIWVSQKLDVNKVWGSLYWGSITNIPFHEPFATAPYVWATCNGMGGFCSCTGITKDKIGTLEVYRPVSSPDITVSISILAIYY